MKFQVTQKHLIGPTTHYLGFEATGKLIPCEYCAQAIIRKGNIARITQGEQAKKHGEEYSLILVQ